MKSTKQSGRDAGQTTSDWSTRTGARARSPHRRAVWLYVLHREAVSFDGRLCRGDGNQGRGNRGRRAVHVGFALRPGTAIAPRRMVAMARRNDEEGRRWRAVARPGGTSERAIAVVGSQHQLE